MHCINYESRSRDRQLLRKSIEIADSLQVGVRPNLQGGNSTFVKRQPYEPLSHPVVPPSGGT
ncbi:hypothetical protein JW964_23995 [candidate division KSB1 bacterium]|nr:hypothetical protein [candidate division KSB1 bacterium]